MQILMNCSHGELDKGFDQCFGIAGKEIDGGKFDHGLGTEVTTGFEAESGTGTGDEDLTGERRVVDGHIKLKTLVMGVAGNAVTDKVDTMSDVIEGIDTLDRDDVGLVVCEIVICQNSGFDGLEIGAFFEFDIDHAAMDTGTQRDRHRKGILDTFDGLSSDRVTH